MICVSEKVERMKTFSTNHKRHSLYKKNNLTDNDMEYEVTNMLWFISKIHFQVLGKNKEAPHCLEISKFKLRTATMDDLKAVVDKVDQIIRLDSNVTASQSWHQELLITTDFNANISVSTGAKDP